MHIIATLCYFVVICNKIRFNIADTAICVLLFLCVVAVTLFDIQFISVFVNMVTPNGFVYIANNLRISK